MDRQRLAGIELIRGAAIYGVVVLHTDAGVHTLPASWIVIRHFSDFAVPFFLATSFYLSSRSLYLNKKPYSLKNRAIRLLLPYVFWSLFYLLYKSLKYLVSHHPERVSQLFEDPISLLFFGGAEFHLYFLTLLLAGTILMKFAEFLVRNGTSSRHILLLTLFSFLIYHINTVAGNNFDLKAERAFYSLTKALSLKDENNPLLRVLLVELAWMIRCLPYVLTAIFLNHPMVAKYLSKLQIKNLTIWLLLFLGINFFGDLILPSAIHDILRGYSALLFALALSNHLKENRLLKSLGTCSFGIYLIHLLFIEMSQSLMIRIDPGYTNHILTINLILISLFVFMVSWIVILLLMRNKILSKIIS